jgi:DNA-binding IclR family transcriptional regulator
MPRSRKQKMKEENRSGTQTIERAVALLREVSERGYMGWQLSDLAARCDLRKSTAHRILTCLVRERLVKQREGDRNYVPGPMLFELGLSSQPERGELQYAARTRLTALAKQTSGVAFLFFRSGDDFVCAARVGPARCQARERLSIFPGTRKPLVLAAGGAAMLLALPKAEASATIRRNLEHLDEYGEIISGVRRMMQRSFDEGFGINAGDIIPGVNAFGLALRDRYGIPFASIAVAGTDRIFPPDRTPEIRSMLEAAGNGLQAAPVPLMS